MACAQLWPDCIFKIKVRAKGFFANFSQLWFHKSFVKQALEAGHLNMMSSSDANQIWIRSYWYFLMQKNVPNVLMKMRYFSDLHKDIIWKPGRLWPWLKLSILFSGSGRGGGGVNMGIYGKFRCDKISMNNRKFIKKMMKTWWSQWMLWRNWMFLPFIFWYHS